MVLPGEYLERSVVVGDLDALYHRGQRAPPCALASPHPAMGGSMTSPVVAELAWALTRAGHPTLRFDYRGVGASRGSSRHRAGSMEIGDLQDEVADLLAACDQLLATARMPKACAIGYSFGAAVALRAARDPRIDRLVLIAPPTRLHDFSALQSLGKRALVVCAHHDAYCDRSLLRLPPEGLLEVIPHADHFFGRGLTALGKHVKAWLRDGRPEYVAAPDGGMDEGSSNPVEVTLDPGDGEPLELDEPDGK
jgi:alpha/beta superfamily hydrolase